MDDKFSKAARALMAEEYQRLNQQLKQKVTDLQDKLQSGESGITKKVDFHATKISGLLDENSALKTELRQNSVELGQISTELRQNTKQLKQNKEELRQTKENLEQTKEELRQDKEQLRQNSKQLSALAARVQKLEDSPITVKVERNVANEKSRAQEEAPKRATAGLETRLPAVGSGMPGGLNDFDPSASTHHPPRSQQPAMPTRQPPEPRESSSAIRYQPPSVSDEETSAKRKRNGASEEDSSDDDLPIKRVKKRNQSSGEQSSSMDIDGSTNASVPGKEAESKGIKQEFEADDPPERGESGRQRWNSTGSITTKGSGQQQTAAGRSSGHRIVDANSAMQPPTSQKIPSLARTKPSSTGYAGSAFQDLFRAPGATATTKYSTKPMTLAQRDVLLEKLKNLKKTKNSVPFLKPVDYIALDIPDYLKVIKNPMDVGTIETKLMENKYKSIQAFADDFDLIVSNAKKFNNPTDPVTQAAFSLEAYFFRMMQGVPSASA